MEINVYDMLVFKDETGNIYQDCVCGIDKENNIISCNQFMLKDDKIIATNGITLGNGKYIKIVCDEIKLKEIWTRTDETTYKKVWYDGDYYYNHLAKETFKDIFQNVQFYSDPEIFEKISNLMDTEYDIFNIDFLNALKFCMASEIKSIARKAAGFYRFYKDAFDQVEKNYGIR